MALSAFASNTASGSGSVAAGNSFTVTKPTGCTTGDLVVVYVVTSDNIGGFSSTDLTEIHEVNETGSDTGMWVGWRIVQSGDGSTYSISSTNTEAYVYAVVALRGADATTPIGATSCVSNSTATSQATPSISVTDTGAWIVCGWGSDGAAPGPTRTPPASPFVEAVDTANGSNGVGMMVGYEDMVGTTGSTSRTCTSSQNDVYVSAITEIIPAAGGTTLDVTGIARTRALGTISVLNKLLMTGIARSRALGSPVVSPQLVVVGIARSRALGSPQLNPTATPSGQARTRALGSPTVGTATVLSATGLVRSRSIGTAPTVSPQLLPAGIARTRTVGSAQVAPGPEGIARTRAVGSPVIDPTIDMAGLVRTRHLGSVAVPGGSVEDNRNLLLLHLGV